MSRIKTGDCTPFLGAAVNFGILPLGRDIAREWAKRFSYPLDDNTDLAKVAQFIGTKGDPTVPKELILQDFSRAQKAFDFSDETDPLNILAKLPFPVYLTTNYDDLLFSAIEHHGVTSNRNPEFEVCKWNASVKVQPKLFKRGSKFQATAQTPAIYHIHGHRSIVDSLVLTEDDYLDFLVNMSKDIETFLPARIQEAITASSLLFIGYSLADIDFRVLFRGLRGNLERALGRMSVAVQLRYDAAGPNREEAEKYITKYFDKINVRVYWGTAREFTAELWKHWKEFNA